MKNTQELPACFVFVPHQDDEVNLIGNCIVYLLNLYDLYVIYSSLDIDVKKGQVRKSEAKRACSILGIQETHIIFMDYPDTPNTEGKHFFENPAKHNEIVADIFQIIKIYKPELIIGTDFDYHSDHRMLSIALEEAICKCINRDYRPIVLKGFCYETAYYGISDYSAVSLGKTKAIREILGNPSYEWEKRISLPSMELEGYIWKKRSYHALKQHKSQYAVLHAASIINADNVFWNRRTDNIALYSEIICSSGNSKVLNDFKIIDTNDIITVNSLQIDYTKGLWKPDELDKEPYIKIILPKKSYIAEIVFHSNPVYKEQTVEIELLIGEQVFVCRNLNGYGRETKIDVNIDNIQEIEIYIKKIEKGFALSEIEIFEIDDIPYFWSKTKEKRQNVKKIDILRERINSAGFQLIVFWVKVRRKLDKFHRNI